MTIRGNRLLTLALVVTLLLISGGCSGNKSATSATPAHASRVVTVGISLQQPLPTSVDAFWNAWLSGQPDLMLKQFATKGGPSLTDMMQFGGTVDKAKVVIYWAGTYAKVPAQEGSYSFFIATFINPADGVTTVSIPWVVETDKDGLIVGLQ